MLLFKKTLVNGDGVYITKLIFYRRYPNLVRTQAEITSDPNYLVRILFQR